MKIIIVTKNKRFKKIINNLVLKDVKFKTIVNEIGQINQFQSVYNADLIIVDICMLYQKSILLSQVSDQNRNKLIVVNHEIINEELLKVRKEIIKNISLSKEFEITNFLLKLGISPNLKGFEYLKKCILILFDESLSLTKIYEKVSLEYKTSPKSVERAIRTCAKRVLNKNSNKDLIFYILNELK